MLVLHGEAHLGHQRRIVVAAYATLVARPAILQVAGGHKCAKDEARIVNHAAGIAAHVNDDTVELSALVQLLNAVKPGVPYNLHMVAYLFLAGCGIGELLVEIRVYQIERQTEHAEVQIGNVVGGQRILDTYAIVDERGIDGLQEGHVQVGILRNDGVVLVNHGLSDVLFKQRL